LLLLTSSSQERERKGEEKKRRKEGNVDWPASTSAGSAIALDRVIPVAIVRVEEEWKRKKGRGKKLRRRSSDLAKRKLYPHCLVLERKKKEEKRKRRKKREGKTSVHWLEAFDLLGQGQLVSGLSSYARSMERKKGKKGKRGGQTGSAAPANHCHQRDPLSIYLSWPQGARQREEKKEKKGKKGGGIHRSSEIGPLNLETRLVIIRSTSQSDGEEGGKKRRKEKVTVPKKKAPAG